ncbi:MAG: hypothetical protein WAX04_01855 [Oscillospiraceae bacterium]
MQHSKKKPKAKSHIMLELIILLLSIATIAFFAIPKLNGMLSTSRQKSADNDAQIIAVAAQAWLTQQETAEIMPTIVEANTLSEGDVKQIISLASSIDAEVAKTVVITVNGEIAPECYQLKSVNLVKKQFNATVNK